jgi:hypothetical protein
MARWLIPADVRLFAIPGHRRASPKCRDYVEYVTDEASRRAASRDRNMAANEGVGAY